MALTANRDLNRYVDQELRTIGVAASEKVFKGSMVGINRATGFARKLVAGDEFAGIAYEEADNTGGAGGAITVRVYTQGDFILPVSGALQARIGSAVYALDDESCTVNPSAGASNVGLLMDVAGTNLGVVRVNALGLAAVEQVVHANLVSLTTGATTNPVMIVQRAIRIMSLEVSFNVKPDVGTLDVGTDNSDPDEIVNNFTLSTLTNQTPMAMTLVTRDVPKGVRVWAKVGSAVATAGVGGILSVRYIELP